MKNQLSLTQRIRALGDRWLDTIPRSPATKRAYRVEILRLLRWLTATGLGRTCGSPPGILIRYLNDISSTQPKIYALADLRQALKPSSILQSKRILAALLMWAAEAEALPLSLAMEARRWKPSAVTSFVKHRPCQTRHPAHAPASEEGRARREFVAALAYWLGASPLQIANLKRQSIRVKGDVLQVRLPDSYGQEVISFGPPAMIQMWRKLNQVNRASIYAIVRIASSAPVSASTIARELRQVDASTSGSNFRTLRRAGIKTLRVQQGWPEATVLKQYRRKSLAQPQNQPTLHQVAQLMSRISTSMFTDASPRTIVSKRGHPGRKERDQNRKTSALGQT